VEFKKGAIAAVEFSSLTAGRGRCFG